jgi:hypothetical protein
MLQIGVGAADEDVDIITLDDSEIMLAVPEPPKKSPKEKQKKKRKKSAQPADTAEEEGRSGGMTEVLELELVHSAEEGAVLATKVASVWPTGESILSTDEVRPIDGVEPAMETVDAPTLMIED